MPGSPAQELNRQLARILGQRIIDAGLLLASVGVHAEALPPTANVQLAPGSSPADLAMAAVIVANFDYKIPPPPPVMVPKTLDEMRADIKGLSDIQLEVLREAALAVFVLANPALPESLPEGLPLSGVKVKPS